MDIPLLDIRTIIYIIALYAARGDGGGTYMPDLMPVIMWPVITVIYLLFWIIYLAVT